MQYTVGTQYTVGLGAKNINSHSGLSKCGWWGLLPSVQKRSNLMPWGMQYSVGVGAKRSTHTVDLGNMLPNTAYCIPPCMGLTFFH